MQKNEPGTHNSIRQIATQISISKSSVHRLVKKKNLHCYKHLKTPQINSACCKRRANVLESFFNIFPSTVYHGLCFKMRKSFPFKYQLIAKTTKFLSMVPRMMCNRNACTAKETSFRKRLWYPKGVIGGNGIELNGASYLKHLHDDLIPAVEAMYLNEDFTFVQDSAPSHRANQVQNFLKQK